MMQTCQKGGANKLWREHNIIYLAALPRWCEIFFRFSTLIFENHTCCCERHADEFLISFCVRDFIYSSYQSLLLSADEIIVFLCFAFIAEYQLQETR